MRVMLKALSGPKHRHMGFYADYVDFGNIWSQSKQRPDLFDPPQGKPSKIFGDYGGDVQGGLLRIFRDVQPRRSSPPAEAQVEPGVEDLVLTQGEIRVLKLLVAGVLASKSL
jgi:hypothetical protein